MTDVASSRKSLLLVFRHAPYGNSLARAGLDVALAAAAFDQQPAILFMDEGVWQLLPGQDSRVTPGKNIRKLLDSFPLYDIDTFHVDEVSLARRQLASSQLGANIRVLTAAELPAFIEGFDQVMNF